SSEGVGTSPNIPYVTIYNYKAQSGDDVWGSTNEETNKDKNKDDDEEMSMKRKRMRKKVLTKKRMLMKKMKKNLMRMIRALLLPTLMMKEQNKSLTIMKCLRKETVAETEEEETANLEHEEDDTKETKTRGTGNAAESLKKSLTPKESTKSKPPSKYSKTGKSAPVDQSVKEPEHEVQMDFEEPTFENVANDADVPHIDLKPRILKLEWFPQPLRPKTPEPDWNIVKTIDDAPEQPRYNDMINAEKPPLTFDELMSKPIDFSAYAMNHLKSDTYAGNPVKEILLNSNLPPHRLHPSQVEILWGMYHEANVDYATMMWEDLQYQIDNRQTKVRRREIMPYPRFTKAIIHHFMSQYKSIFKREEEEETANLEHEEDDTKGVYDNGSANENMRQIWYEIIDVGMRM
nr:hypothetical protein [Tanacetum cinerariifolium]